MKGVPITNSPVLLYKGSKHGITTTSFHSRCDNKGATVVFFKVTSGAVFGGYSKVSWDSSSAWVSDSSAFLFSLISSNKEERFTKLIQNNVNTQQQAKYCTSTSGPEFADINIPGFSTSNPNYSSSLCQHYCEPGMVYNSEKANTFLAGAFYFQLEDVEIYSFN